jgi:hypothetical protein
MKTLTIKRTSSSMQGVFGMMMDDNGLPLCLTAERPWMDNEPNISCIPAGVYPLIQHNSHHFGEVVKVDNVPHRTRILMHKGNNPMQDSRGCILLGYKLGFYAGSAAILNSTPAFNAMMDYLNGEDAILIIEDCYMPKGE